MASRRQHAGGIQEVWWKQRLTGRQAAKGGTETVLHQPSWVSHMAGQHGSVGGVVGVGGVGVVVGQAYGTLNKHCDFIFTIVTTLKVVALSTQVTSVAL